MNDAVVWIGFLLGGWGTSFSGYLVLQAVALLALKRWFFLVALIPLGAIIYVTIVTVTAYQQQSNLWPMLLVFSSPVALLVIAGITAVGVHAQSHPRKTPIVYFSLGLIAFVSAFLAYALFAAA